MTQAAIQVQGVWKKFRRGEIHDSLRDLIPALVGRALGRGPAAPLSQREFWALRDVTFELAAGQSLGIIGPNGAGKSTLLKLLTRIIRPTQGTYQVHGRLSSLIEIGAGFHPDLTGRENIYINGAILGMKRADIRRKEEQIIDFAGIREFIDTPVKRYSSGMGARLGFAVAAHMDPEVLLVDEVLSVGDVKFRAKCLHYMHQLLRSGITVVFISHILDQVRSLCPNTLVLDRGQVCYLGPTDGAIRKYLDLLSNGVETIQDRPSAARIAGVRFLDADGRETLDWQARQPGVVEFELHLAQPLAQPVVLINFASIGGSYLGTAGTQHAELALSGTPGTWRVRFAMDPMPLGEGDYGLEIKIHDAGRNWECLWSSPQPHTFTVRGPREPGPALRCDGRWQVTPLHAGLPAAAGER